MKARLDELNKGAFHPQRGVLDPRACDAWDGFYGPWIDVPGKSAVGGDVGVMDISYKAQWHLQEGDALSMRVPCKPMEYYLKEFAHVDFFSLDVEGDVRS